MVAADKRILKTLKGHQWLTLIGFTFVLFEVVFIGLYSDNFWFSFDLNWLGLPTILVCALSAHGLLTVLETGKGCWFTSFLWKGKPAFPYIRWVELDSDGFSFGLRRVRFEVVNEVELSWFGNLIIRSRAICGDAQKEPDIVFKLPFSIASQKDQSELIDALKASRPGLVMNERLTKRLVSPVVKGQNFIQSLGGAMMLVLLLDLGLSSFYYLDLLKQYYLASTEAIANQTASAKSHLAAGDNLRLHPLPFSYVTSRFLTVGSCAAGICEARADALWALGSSDDALAEAKKAIEYSPDSFRVYLHNARLLQGAGHTGEARAQIAKAIDKHKDSLLPRLYLLAQAKESNPDQVQATYQQSMDELAEKTFRDEPSWPPGGENFLHDVFYKKDIYFVLDRLLGVSVKPANKFNNTPK